LILAGILASGTGFVAAADVPVFVGAFKCRDCHRTERQGKQLGIWESSNHALSFSNLRSAAAGPVAKAAGIAGPPEKNPACLKCHAPLSEIAPALAAEGVTCEVCHGAGSNYRKLAIMMNRDKAVANGLIVFESIEAVKTRCLECHVTDHGRPWEFETAWDAIGHYIPAKRGRGFRPGKKRPPSPDQ